MQNNLVGLLKQLGVIYRESVNLKNAGPSNFYIDIKKVYGYPKILNLISETLWEKINRNSTCIAAAGYGGLPPATLISSKYNLHLTLIREKPKEHGKTGLIEGYVPNQKDKIVIIDDVFTTGKSLKEMIEVLEKTKAEILGCYVIVKRGDGNLQVPLTHLLTLEELL